MRYIVFAVSLLSGLVYGMDPSQDEDYSMFTAGFSPIKEVESEKRKRAQNGASPSLETSVAQPESDQGLTLEERAWKLLGEKDSRLRKEKLLELLDAGLNPCINKPYSRKKGFRPLLDYFASQGWYDETLLLLTYGAEVDAKDSYGRTVLHHRVNPHSWLATRTVTLSPEYQEVIKLLLMCGADPLKQNVESKCARDHIAQIENEEIKEMIKDFTQYCKDNPHAIKDVKRDIKAAKTNKGFADLERNRLQQCGGNFFRALNIHAYKSLQVANVPLFNVMY